MQYNLIEYARLPVDSVSSVCRTIYVDIYRIKRWRFINRITKSLNHSGEYIVYIYIYIWLKSARIHTQTY